MLKTLPYPWTPRDIASAKLTIFPSYVDMLGQEHFGTSASLAVITPVAASNTACGTIIAPQDGHVLTTQDNAVPTFLTDASGSGVQRRCFVRYGASGTTYHELQNGAGAFRFLYTSQCYTVAFWIRMGAGSSNTANYSIFDTAGQAGGAPGWSLYRYTDGYLYWFVGSGGATFGGNAGSGQYTIGGSAGFGLKSGGQLLNDGNWHFVMITCTGVGGVATLQIDGSYSSTGWTNASTFAGSTPSQATYSPVLSGASLGTNAQTSGNALINPRFGRTGSGASALGAVCDLDNITVCDSVVSASDAVSLYNFNPGLQTASLLRCNTSSTKLLPTDISHAWHWIDFTAAAAPDNDQPLMYTSASYPPSAANAITSYNTGSLQSIKYVENRTGAHLLRYLTAPTPTVPSGSPVYPLPPVWTPGGMNGHPGAVFAGAWNSSSSPNQSNPTALNYNQLLPPIDKTWYCVAQQTSNGNSGSPGVGQIGSHLFGYLGNAGYLAIGGRYHTAPDAVIEHLNTTGTNSPEGTTFAAITFTAVTSPATAGTYTLVTATNQNPSSNSGAGGYNNSAVTNVAQTYLGFTNGSTPSFYCAATGMYLYYSGNNWFISVTNGANATYLGSGNYWRTTNNENDILSAYTAEGSASTNTTPTGSPAAGPIAPHVIHGQQAGSMTRIGCDNRWGAWTPNTSPTGAMVWNAMGYDFQQGASPFDGVPSNTQHFELNATVYEFAVFTYSLPDHVFNGLMKKVQDRFAIPMQING